MRTHLLSALSLVATLSLVGCGGSDDDTSTTTTDTGASTEETSTTDTGASTDDTGTSTDDTGTPMDTGTATDTGTPPTDTGSDTAMGASTWTQVYAVFSAGGKCTTCHGGSGGLNLSNKATAYAQLKLKAAGSDCVSTGKFRVAPGDAANSLLVDKIAKPSSMVCGDRMPRGSAALPDADIDKVRSWINAGALDN